MRTCSSSTANDFSGAATLSRHPRSLSTLNTTSSLSPSNSREVKTSSRNDVNPSVNPGISAGISLSAVPTAERSIALFGSIFENWSVSARIRSLIDESFALCKSKFSAVEGASPPGSNSLSPDTAMLFLRRLFLPKSSKVMDY